MDAALLEYSRVTSSRIEEDPLLDTGTLEHVRFVMKDGIVYFSGGESEGQP
jgi:hypothetical protein